MALGKFVCRQFYASAIGRALNRRAVYRKIYERQRQRRDAERRRVRFDAAHREPGKLGRNAARDTARAIGRPAKSALE